MDWLNFSAYLNNNPSQGLKTLSVADLEGGVGELGGAGEGGGWDGRGILPSKSG